MTAPLRTGAELAAAGLVAPDRAVDVDAVAARYAVSLSAAVAGLIDPADPADPIARQFIPSVAELDSAPDELADPIGDGAHEAVPGIVHRYPDRVLLKLLHVCPVYCRFCFRREAVGPQGETHLSPAALDAALAYVAARPAIWEVILTGGDPLALSPRRLADVMGRLAAIPHVKVLRVHTRVPVVAPERITAELAATLCKAGKTVFVAVHANHPRELTVAARAACDRLFAAGIGLVSQSVLLRGVNDEVATLEALMRAFVEARIKPYYLHQLDFARGTSHFRVPLAEGRALMQGLAARVSGLCLPRYVVDLPGGHGKVSVLPDHALLDEEGRITALADARGGRHAYPPKP
jgi:lysine 2,3-aminomutase